MWPTFDPDFWKNFWPDFIAGILSVFLGAYAAFLVAKWQIRKTDEGVRRQDCERLDTALEVLTKAIEGNSQRLENLSNRDANVVDYLPELEAIAWDAVKGEVTPFVGDAALLSKMANYFDALKGLLRVNDLYINYSKGVQAALSGSQEQRAHLHSLLTTRAKTVRAQGEEIRSLLRDRNQTKATRGSAFTRKRRCSERKKF